MQAICRDRGWALIVDEVFADYLLDARAPRSDLAVNAPVLTFSLGGASKTLGLPQVKLGWIIVGGPDAERREALDGLEHIADTYLSVGTPVQLAAGSLLQAGGAVREAIHARVRAEPGARPRASRPAFPRATVLPVEGGWTVVVRVPALQSEEALAAEPAGTRARARAPRLLLRLRRTRRSWWSACCRRTPRFADAFERTLRHACTPS